MAINYTTNITSLFAGSVGTDAAYQVPGTFHLPVGFGTTPAQQRLLTFIEICRAYMALMDNNHEAKLLHVVMGKMMGEMKFGTSSWNTTTMPADVQKAALLYLSKHILATDL